MQVNSAFVADLRELLSSNNLSQVENLTFSHLTIGAVVELTCLRSMAQRPLRAVFDRWAQSSLILRDAFHTYENGKLPSTSNMWAARNVDFFPLRGQNWSEECHYHPFESRFRKAAKEAGFGSRADGLTGALFEMADNVAQHSGPNSSDPSPGLIGYYVNDGHVAFAVGDSGRGVLTSLKENPAWADLPNSQEALVAVINNHASRRPHGGDGEGFKQMFRSLADLNGIVIMCSNEGRVKLNQTPLGRKATAEFTGPFPGVQLSVNCSLSGSPQEQTFSI